ncbi:MAG: Mrp/NBP35 family ATP-binding protein [Candidatus Bathyarchaeota archaeon]|nr:Mrp/NBP35 family ATP-binding protein [Candidatus Bathyarchaeota archaeon]
MSKNGDKPGSASTKDNPEVSRQPDEEMLRSRMTKIRHKIAVISGKGGVGKSLVTVNLAMALAIKGRNGRVGVLDADLHGPCVPKMLGLKGERLQSGPPGIFPALGPLNMKVVSMAFLLPSDDAPVIWRGPLKMGAIRQFLSEISWGNLDYLLIDLPPGTGDESLSVLQLIPEMEGVIIVTIPSEVSQDVVKKAVSFARKMGVPILGIVENMSGMVCPHCGETIDVFSKGGGERVAKEMSVEFLGSIPLDPRISADSDEGTPFVVSHPDSTASKAFMRIVEQIEEKVK